MGKCASVTYKRLASLLSTKQEQLYSATINCHAVLVSLSCALQSCAYGGARSSQERAFRFSVIDLAVAEAKVPSVSV